MEINMRIYNKCPDFQRGRTKDIGNFFFFQGGPPTLSQGKMSEVLRISWMTAPSADGEASSGGDGREGSVYDAGVPEGGLDGVVDRDVEAVEGFVFELREAADKSLELRHHVFG